MCDPSQYCILKWNMSKNWDGETFVLLDKPSQGERRENWSKVLVPNVGLSLEGPINTYRLNICWKPGVHRACHCSFYPADHSTQCRSNAIVIFKYGQG